MEQDIRDWDAVLEFIFKHCEWPDDLSKDEIIFDIQDDIKVTTYGFCYEGDEVLRFSRAGQLL